MIPDDTDLIELRDELVADHPLLAGRMERALDRFIEDAERDGLSCRDCTMPERRIVTPASLEPLDPGEVCERHRIDAAHELADDLEGDGEIVWAGDQWRVAGYQCGSCNRVMLGENPATLVVYPDEVGEGPEPWCARCVKHAKDEAAAIDELAQRDARLNPQMSPGEAQDIHDAGRGHLLTDEQRRGVGGN